MSVVNLCHLCCYIISIGNRLAKIAQPLQQPQPQKESTNKLIIDLICILFFTREFPSDNKTAINRSHQVNAVIITGKQHH